MNKYIHLKAWYSGLKNKKIVRWQQLTRGIILGEKEWVETNENIQSK